MSKSSHPADTANVELIAQAVCFDISLFPGRNIFACAIADTKTATINAAQSLERAHPECSRFPPLYAVRADCLVGARYLAKQSLRSDGRQKTNWRQSTYLRPGYFN
jgi:hypothetical protein